LSRLLGVVEAFKTQRKERASIMQDVPLKAHRNAKKKRLKSNSS
jgi:hypothetical protein